MERQGRIVWPEHAKCAVMLSFDFDAELVWGDLDSSVYERAGVLSNGQYGARRGVQRCLDVLKQFDLQTSWMIPGLNVVNYPQQVAAIAENGHEIGNHGWAHENFGHRTIDEQKVLLRRTNDAIRDLTGQRPVGFRAPAGEFTDDTLRLLADEGFRWSSLTRSDDRPYVVETDDGPTDMIEIPAHWYLDDFPCFMFNRTEPSYPAGQSRIASYSAVLSDWKREFDAFYDQGLCFVIMFHPQTIGTPGRIRLLVDLIEHIKSKEQVWFATGSEIADWWRTKDSAKGAGHPDIVFRQVSATK